MRLYDYFFLIIIFVLGYILFLKIKEITKLKNEKQSQDISCNKKIQDLRSEYSKYSNIIEIDKEVDKRKQDILDMETKVKSLEIDYQNKKVVYDNLGKEIEAYKETTELISMGVYEPHFDFGTSAQYKDKIVEIREKQKDMVKGGTAIKSFGDWSVDGSKKKGQKLVKDNIKLTMRSFNNECDVIIKNVTWKNINNMEERMRKSFEYINKFNESAQIMISYEYLSLKVKEMYLVYEHALKAQSEKEYQAELRRQEKEEQELLRDLDRIAREEDKLQNLLDKIKQKAEQASYEAKVQLEQEIYEIGEELKKIQREHDRVKTMAEQTKYGYVYIISNVGSFGENIFKIGLTRRLDPMDRVRELSTASVPFIFDVHAIIFSEDAPALETQLHRKFSAQRVNLVNFRKEFFKVNINDLKQALFEIDSNIEFIEDIEAKEYVQTLEIMNSRIIKETEMLN